MSNRMMEAALQYVEEGWYVFPLAPHSKIPMKGSNGFLDATRDPEQIRKWWAAHPDANIGGATGSKSGRTVVDVDVKNDAGGDVTFEALREEVGAAVFETRNQRTQSGGTQYIYRRPDGLRIPQGTHKLGKGIDVKDEGGYVVLPPSVTDVGRYEWNDEFDEDMPLLEFPQVLIDKIRVLEDAKQSAHSTSPGANGKMREHDGRDNRFAQIAGSLRHYGADEGAIRECLGTLNPVLCQDLLSDRDLDRIARSIGKKPSGDANGATVDATADLETVDACDLLARPYAPPRFLVEHLIAERGLTLLSADTGAGKSSFMFHASLSLGFALPVAGRFGCAAQDRPVLYLNGEMSVDVLTNFLHANARGIGVDVADLPRGRLIFEGENGLSDIFVGLDDGTSARNLERLMERHRPALVVIDTFRALFEADENKTREVRTVLAWLRMLSEQFSCAIVVSHHLRKLSAISNGVRERVSGVRDLIAAVDIHVALLSPSGQPANRLRLDKTRLPFEGVTAGTEWPLEACWLDGKPPSSTFAAGGPTQQNVTPVETAEDEILAIIAAEGPKTIKQLDADGGSRKRALEVLRGKGSLVKVGKRDRAILLGFPGTGNEAEIIDLDSWRDRVR